MASHDLSQLPSALDLPVDDESSWAICLHNHFMFIPRGRNGIPLRPLCGLQLDARSIAQAYNTLLDVFERLSSSNLNGLEALILDIEKSIEDISLSIYEEATADKVDGYEVYMINERNSEDCILVEEKLKVIGEVFSDPLSALDYARRKVGENKAPEI